MDGINGSRLHVSLALAQARARNGERSASLWHRVLNDSQLWKLPYKVETSERGQIVLSPHKPQHGLRRARISVIFSRNTSRLGDGRSRRRRE